MSKRVPCGLTLRMRLGTVVFDVALMNISTTGMFVCPSPDSPRDALVMAARLKPGARVFLRFEVAGRLELYEARGSVAWRSDLGIGVDFFEVSPPMRELIARLVEGNGHDQATLQSVTVATLHQP